MKKWLGRIGIVLGVLVLLLIGSWVWIWTAPPPKLEVGPDTTVIEEPLRDDGTVDYIAALNQRYSEGVTPENNAFVIIAQLMSPDQWDTAALREKTFDQLGVAMPDEDAAYFQSFTDYAENRLNAEQSAGDDESRASEEISAAAGFGEQPWDPEYERATQSPWSPEDAPWVADWLEQQQTSLDAFAEAAGREHYWSPYTTEHEDALLFDMVLPHLILFRPAANGLQMRALRRLDDDDIEGAIADVLAIKHLGYHLADAPTILEQLVGMGIVATGTDVVTAIAGHESLTPEQARDFARDLRAVHRPFDTSLATDRAERYYILDVLQRSSADSSTPPGLTGFNIDAITGRIDRNRAMRQVNAQFDAIVDALTASTHADRVEQLTQIEDEAEQRLADLSSPSLKWAAIAIGNRRALTDAVTDLLLGLLSGSYKGFATEADRSRLMTRLEHVALAAGGYRAEHGRYPSTLEDLTPEWLEEIPADLFDPDEKPLRYRVDDESILIYSVGRNGEDDGGEEFDESDKGDIVLELP